MCCKVKDSMFYRITYDSFIIMVVAMGDLTLASNSSSLLSNCKSDLKSEFEISKMGRYTGCWSGNK